MHKPLISVVVPCYNQAQYLDECLQSVLDQTYPNWECIIVNDGSPDHTDEVAKKWVEKDNRFKYLYKENGGLSSARNAGMKEAQGEYIQLLDCDDYIANNKFELQIRDLITNDISISDYTHFGKSKELVDQLYRTPFSEDGFNLEDVILKWEVQLSIPCHCIIFKKVDLLFNEKLKNHEDWVFWVQLFYINKRIVYNSNILAFYRYSPNSLSRNDFEMNEGFHKACDDLHSYFRSIKENGLSTLIKKKKNQLIKIEKMSAKELLAHRFPKLFQIYGQYLK